MALLDLDWSSGRWVFPSNLFDFWRRIITSVACNHSLFLYYRRVIDFTHDHNGCSTPVRSIYDCGVTLLPSFSVHWTVCTPTVACIFIRTYAPEHESRQRCNYRFSTTFFVTIPKYLWLWAKAEQWRLIYSFIGCFHWNFKGQYTAMSRSSSNCAQWGCLVHMSARSSQEMSATSTICNRWDEQNQNMTKVREGMIVAGTVASKRSWKNKEMFMLAGDGVTSVLGK